MTRSQFILGVALLAVSGSLAFTISFKNQEEGELGPMARSSRGVSTTDSTITQLRPSAPSISNETDEYFRVTNRPPMDRTYYEISVSRIEDEPAAIIVEEDALDRLENYTDRYQLTPLQRREIFPLIAVHHPSFREGMLVNGQAVTRTSLIGGIGAVETTTTSLEDAIYIHLDTTQQEQLQEDLLAKTEWWKDVLGQLREDLDRAIDEGEGELVPIEEPLPNPPSDKESELEQPAVGDGQKIKNEGLLLDALERE